MICETRVRAFTSVSLIDLLISSVFKRPLANLHPSSEWSRRRYAHACRS